MKGKTQTYGAGASSVSSEDLVCFCKFTLINEKIFGVAFLNNSSLNSSISWVVANCGYLEPPGGWLFLFDNDDDDCDPDNEDCDPDNEDCDPARDGWDPDSDDGCDRTDEKDGGDVGVAGEDGRFDLLFVGTSWFRVFTAIGIRLWVSPRLLISIFWWIKCDGPAEGAPGLAAPFGCRTGIRDAFAW